MTQNQLSKLKDETLARKIAEKKAEIKQLEAELELLSTEAVSRNIPSFSFPDMEVKVGLREGNSKASYDAVKIGMELPMVKFSQIVNVVDSKAKEVLSNEEYAIVVKHKSEVLSEKKIVSVTKMTQKELKG